MELQILDIIEKRLSALIEAPFRSFFTNSQAGNLLAKRLVEAMGNNLHVDESGRLNVPIYYEIHINPIHAALWRDPPDLTGMLTTAIDQAAHDQGVVFEMHPVINVCYDATIGRADIQVITLDESELAGETTVTPVLSPETGNLPEDAFLIINGARHMVLDQPVITIGRSSTNQLIFDDPQVSRLHAQLRAVDGIYHIFDLDSTGGTLVNGQPVQHAPLHPGDVIDIGNVSMVYGQDSTPADKTTSLPTVRPQGEDSP